MEKNEIVMLTRGWKKRSMKIGWEKVMILLNEKRNLRVKKLRRNIPWHICEWKRKRKSVSLEMIRKYYVGKEENHEVDWRES